jgi:pyroglutamyl-peptidase
MINNPFSRILVTGFGPFRDIVDNPSSKLAASCGASFKILDVAYAAVDETVSRLDPETFDVLLMLGVVAKRDRMCPEFFARNFIGKHPDVTGALRFGSIDEQACLLLPTTLWDAAKVAEWTIELPIHASYDAGNYLCNYVFFRALERFPKKKVGFLHVPSLEKVALERQVQVLATILKSIADSPPSPD